MALDQLALPRVKPGQFTPKPLATEIAERDRFLDELRESGSVAVAAARLGVTPGALARARKKHRGFAAACDLITGRGADELEAAMLDRAINGVERYKFFANGAVEIWREFDGVTARLMLSKRLPQVYGDAIVSPGMVTVKPITRAQFIEALDAVAD